MKRKLYFEGYKHINSEIIIKSFICASGTSIDLSSDFVDIYIAPIQALNYNDAKKKIMIKLKNNKEKRKYLW